MSFCLYIVTDKNSHLPDSIIFKFPTDPYLCRRKNAASEFMEYSISIAILISNLIDTAIVPMLPLTKEERKRFKQTTHFN